MLDSIREPTPFPHSSLGECGAVEGWAGGRLSPVQAQGSSLEGQGLQGQSSDGGGDRCMWQGPGLCVLYGDRSHSE